MEKESFITKEKKKELEDELEYLKNTRRQEIAKDLEYAKSLGDLSENAEYHEARGNQAELEERINQIENLLRSAIVVTKRKTDVVEVGSTVVIKKGSDGKKYEFYIVGAEEADLGQNKISHTSPLGSALTGSKKGEVVKVETPKGESVYTVIKIV